MSTADRQAIAKVKSIEGEVVAISPDGTKRVLMAGDIIYSDEVVDTSKGKVLLVQDGDVVLQTDIAAILGQGELSPEEKAKIEKILKDLEGDEKEALAKAKAAQEQIAALGTGEQGQEMHEEPAYDLYKGSTSDVKGQAQVFISFERPGLTEPTFFNDDTPEIFVPPAIVINPTELRATTLNQLANPTDANAIGDYFGILGQNNNIVSQDLSIAFDVFMHSHPDVVFAVTVTGNISDYMAAPLEFPVPIILPFGLGVQPWKVVTGDAPNTISYLYRKEDLNLLSAQEQDSKQDLIDSANQHLQSIADVKNVIEQQISGISDLSLDQFEIKANLNASFVVYDNLKNQLQLEIGQLSTQKVVAEANLAVWEATVHNFGIPLGSISNAAAIISLETSWKALGGTPETIPGQLESLYAEKAVFDQVINHLDAQILADQYLLDGIIQDVITPLLILSNYNPINDTDYKQVLIHASQELDKQDALAQGYKNALLNALENIDLVLRTGLANDSDFAFKSQVLLVDSISALNPVVVGNILDQNGGLVNVDALASGLKVELNGDLSHDQTISISSQFDAITTKIILNLDLKFANPSADENIHIEIPGVPGLNWNITNAPANGWVLHADNSLTLDLPSTSPVFSSRTGLIDTLELSFPTTLLKNIELNNFTYKILINSEVIPVGDNEINLNNNTLSQSFNFDINGKLPGRGIYFVESESQADALANVEKHASVDIKPLLQNISVYLDILSGPAETNFLNNTKIEFRFFNTDPLEPPKVLFNDGVVHSYDFVKSGDSWILTGQALKDYIDAWNAATPINKAYYENPVIIAAPYGAEDMLLKVSGLINGANEVVVQDLVPVVVDAVAQKITADDVDLSNVVFNIDFTKFNLKVNITAPDGDGSESRLVDIDLTHVFNYTSDVPANFNPNWTVFSNNGVWTIDTVSVPGEVHLKGNIQGVVGNMLSSELILGFSTATLEYLPKNVSGNYEIVIGSSAFDTPLPGENLAGVISKEILDNNEQDFNLTDDQIGPVYLAAGTTVEVPASIVIRKEAQVDVPDLTPGQDSYNIDISKALVDLYATISLDLVAKAIVDAGGVYVPGTNPTVDELYLNTKILVLENGSENVQFTLEGSSLFNKLHDYVTAAPADQAAIGKILYYVGQYEAEINTVKVQLTDAGNTPIIIYPDLVGGIILPEKTVVFDAVGSGTEIPDLALMGVVLGFPTSTLNLNFEVDAKDITTEKVEIIIELPNAPDPSMLKEFAPPGIVFGWQLDPASAPEWTLVDNVLKGVFDLSTLLTTNIASSLALKFNTSVLINLDQNVADSNIFKLDYAIHSIDSDFPANYILSDNQSPDITGTFNLDVGNLAGIYLIKELDNTNFDAADAILPANNQALLVNINDVMVQLFNKINDAGYDTSSELTQFFASSNIKVEITQSTLAITEDNVPRVGLNDPNEIILPANATGEDRLIDTNNVSLGTTIISGTLLTEIYDAWVASNTDVALRTVPEIAIFGGPFYDNDFKLKVSSTIADILDSADNQSLEVFPETTIVVDATAWGVETINNVPQFFVTPDLDWVIDSTTGLLTGYVDVKYTFDASFLDLTGLEFHQAILDLSSIPGVDQATMQIVAQSGTDVAWSKPVAGTGIFTSDAMFSSTANPDMVGSVTIRFNGATLPADFFDNYGLKTVGLNAIFKIVSTIVPVDQEFITADNQTTSTYNSPLVAISNGVDEQGALVNLPQVPAIPPRTLTLDTVVDFTKIFEQLESLYVVNGIVTNSTNIKASSVVVEVSGIPTTQEIPDVYFNNILQDVFNPDSVQNGLGKLFSQGGLSSGIVYTLTSDELLQVFTAWLNGGDAHVIVQSGLYNSYPFSVSADGKVIQPNLVPLDVVGQVDTLVRVDASAEGFVNNTMSIDSNVSFETNEDTGLLTGNAIVEVILKGQLTDIDGSETYRIEIQMPNATGNQFSLYTGLPANELQWVSLGGGKFAADINLSATSGQPGYVSPAFFDNFSTTGEFDTSVKLLISNNDLSGLSSGQIQLVGVLSSHDNQSVATGSTLTSGVIEIVSDNNDYKVVMPQVNDSNQVSTTKVNELIWDQEIVKLAFQNVNYDQLLPIPIFKSFIESFKTAVDTSVLFLNSDALIGQSFTFKVDLNGNNPAWGNTKAYIAGYNDGVNSLIAIDLVISHPTPTTTQYTATIDGQYLKALYDAYFNDTTFSQDDINYLTNIFVALPTGFDLANFTDAILSHTQSGSSQVPSFSDTFLPTETGLPAVPAPTFASTAVEKQAIVITIEGALDYLYTQLVSGGALDAARLSASSIVVSLKGVDGADSLVYMVDPNPSVPLADPSQIGVSPNANNVFLAGSGDSNTWTITGADLVQLFTQRFGSTPSNVSPADLPNVGIVGKIFEGQDLSVKLDVFLNNPSAPTTTQNIIPETLYVVDDSSHGSIVNRIYDEGLTLNTTVTYLADSNPDDQFDGPDTTGGITGDVRIKFAVDAGVLDVSTGEQHYLVIEMFPSNLIGNNPLNLPEIQIISQGNNLNWVEYETLQGSIFIAKLPDNQQQVTSDFDIKMSLADLKEKGYIIDKDTSESDIYYTQLNQLAINFDAALKLYSTLDASYIINGYNTGSLNMVDGVDGSATNNSLINSNAAEQPDLTFNYSSVPVATADDLANIDNTNTFYLSILPILSALKDRLDFLGLIANDDIITNSNITITITGKNGVMPTLAGDAPLPDDLGATTLFSLLDGGPTYVLNSTNLLTYYNLWNSPTTTPAEKTLLETWFFPPEVGNNRDFTVQVDYKIASYDNINILPIEETLLEPHLVIVRAVADSTVDAALLDGTQPIVHTGAVPALPGGDAPADAAFDFNAADAARFITQLHVKIDFGEPNPDVNRLVEIFLPKEGPDAQNLNYPTPLLGWKMVPGADNGWQIDNNYLDDPTKVRLYKLFEPGSTTGNIDDYLDLSFLMTGIGGYNLRSLTGSGPGPIIPDQYMGLTYKITTITENVDLGGGDSNAQLSDVVTGSATQDIIVPSFVNVTNSAPVFTTQNDYYFVSNPQEETNLLTISRTIIGLGAVVSGSQNDPDDHYDYWYSRYTDVENGVSGDGFNNLRDMLVNNDVGVPVGLSSMTQVFPFYAETNLQDQHVPGSNFLLPGDAVTDSIYSFISFSWANSGDTHTFNYSYQLRAGGASSSVTEYGVGRFFEPGEGDDIVVGSYGRDIFKSSQNDFVGGVNTPLVDSNTQPMNLGNDVFVGGLGRDWIEGGAGNDIAYSDGMPASPNPYTGAQNADVGGLFLMSGINSASIYFSGITDVIATGAGNDIIYTGGSNYDSLSGAGGPSITGHDAVGISSKDAGVLVFAGSGDNFIFSGKGADIIVLDDTIGITRVVPTSSGFVVPTEYNLDNGLHYVYNSDVTGGNFAGLFTGSGDAATFNTAQTLNANGSLSVISDYNGSGSGIQNSYLYDIIRPIYDAATDTDLTYTDNTSGATDAAFRTAEHGANTLVYWKDSVSSSANSADVVMYFNVASDKINLTALFEELSPNMSQTDRLAAINLTQITSVTPIDSTSNGFGTASYDPFSTDGREGTRVSVNINGSNYVIADLANVHTTDVNAVKQNVFEVMVAPEAHLS